MDKITINPGLQHLAEKVFWDLDVDDLKICAQINLSCKQILQTPMFCLRKFEHFSKKNKKDWIKVIQSAKNPNEGISIMGYLQWNFKKDAAVDLQCYVHSVVQDDFRKKIMENCQKKETSDEDTEIVKTLAPLTKNPNDPDKNGRTPIYWAAQNGHTEIIKILALLTDNPISPDKWGDTPIHIAALFRHTEIIKILASLSENPNAPNANGRTPIFWAAGNGCIEIVKILAPLTDNPIAPDRWGDTPIYRAACFGHTEIVKILVPFSENPNVPNSKGNTPIYFAARNGHTEIVEILGPLTQNPNAPNAFRFTQIQIIAIFVIGMVMLIWFIASFMKRGKPLMIWT